MAAVVTHMRNRPPGRWTVKEIAADLGLTDAETSALKDGLKKKRTIHAELASLGIDYAVEGAGGGRKSFLVKHQ